MIKLIRKHKQFGFQITFGNNKEFLPVGGVAYIESMPVERMQYFLDKARRLEAEFMGATVDAPISFNDMLSRKGMKFVQASGGKAKLSLPNLKARCITLRSYNLEADVEYLAMRLFNHYNFNMEGCTYQLAKTVLRNQLKSAL